MSFLGVSLQEVDIICIRLFEIRGKGQEVKKTVCNAPIELSEPDTKTADD